MTRSLYEPTTPRDITSIDQRGARLARRPSPPGSDPRYYSSYFASDVGQTVDNTATGITTYKFPKVSVTDGPEISQDAIDDVAIEVIDNTGGYNDGNGDPVKAMQLNVTGLWLVTVEMRFQNAVPLANPPLGFQQFGLTIPSFAGEPSVCRKMVSKHTTVNVQIVQMDQQLIRVPQDGTEFIMVVSHNAAATLSFGRMEAKFVLVGENTVPDS